MGSVKLRGWFGCLIQLLDSGRLLMGMSQYARGHLQFPEAGHVSTNDERLLQVTAIDING